MNTGGAPTTDDWRRLGKAIEDRRFDMNLSQEDLVKRGGPSHQTVRNIERGIPADYRPTTFRKLDRALSWADGTTEKILNGMATEEELRATVARAGVAGARAQLGGTVEPAGDLQLEKIPADDDPMSRALQNARALQDRARREPPSLLAAELLAVVAAFDDLDPAEEELLEVLARAVPVLRRRAGGRQAGTP